MKLATLGTGRVNAVVIVGVGGSGSGGTGDNERVGVGVGLVVGVTDGKRRRGERSLSFRLETGRSPKSRIHLTEGQRNEFRKKFKCQLVNRATTGRGKKKDVFY